MTTTDTARDVGADPIPGRSISDKWIIVGSLALIATVVTIIAFMLVESVALLSIATLLFAAFAFTHGVLRYGLRAMARGRSGIGGEGHRRVMKGAAGYDHVLGVMSQCSKPSPLKRPSVAAFFDSLTETPPGARP